MKKNKGGLTSTTAPKRGFRARRHRRPLAVERVWRIFSEVGKAKEQKTQAIISTALQKRQKKKKVSPISSRTTTTSTVKYKPQPWQTTQNTPLPFTQAFRSASERTTEHQLYNTARDLLEQYRHLPKKFRFITAQQAHSEIGPVAKQVVAVAEDPKLERALQSMIKDQGFHINALLPPSGRTALSVAAGCGSVNALNTLLSNNADVNRVDRSKYSPLHWAAANGLVN